MLVHGLLDENKIEVACQRPKWHTKEDKREKRGSKEKYLGISVGALVGRDDIDHIILLKPRTKHHMDRMHTVHDIFTDQSFSMEFTQKIRNEYTTML